MSSVVGSGIWLNDWCSLKDQFWDKYSSLPLSHEQVSVDMCSFVVADSQEENSNSISERLHTASLFRQAEFRAGRFCLSQALFSLNGADGTPSWPQNYVGSISHARFSVKSNKGVAIAAIAQTDKFKGVGVDVEKIMNQIQATRIGKQILRRDNYVGEQHLFPYHVLISIFFSAKESAFKALNRIHPRAYSFSDFLIKEYRENSVLISCQDLSEVVSVYFFVIGNFVFTFSYIGK